ncbi:peptidoglycan DD-metalloendopeptidase family protein [Reichenbachiella versicolor]|uniref:peptidoglycan DD-metalloendopeptidase family protein n=1 Tax=Reichenbachiella versicolor TaxID=1821036 RepID=UPI000D6E99AA|nr:peptidoglycan DD-metalloendopeptidase family protein [Reichenbachiella versicolor]
MYRLIILICLIVLGATLESPGQKKRSGDFFKFKNKRIKANQEEDSIIIDVKGLFVIDDLYLDSLEWKEQKELEALLKEQADTAQIVLSYEVPIEVAEQIFIDSVWVTLKEYYSTWSSTDVNPYHIDGEKFKDTLRLPLIFEKPNLAWSLPLEKIEVTSPFGLRRWKWHYGDDFRLVVGDSVRASFDGVVRISKYNYRGYGHYVLVRHYNGLETLYGHLSKRAVKVGDIIKAGEAVGLGGNTGRSTGPHLHYEIRYEGNAIDPEEIFDYEALTIKADTLEITPNTFSYLKEARKIRFHRVRSGDTLSGIAYRYGISINKICRLNGIRRTSILRIGQRLRIT